MLQGMLIVPCHCRACVGRVVEGEVDMSDVSRQLIAILGLLHGWRTALQKPYHPLHLLLEGLHRVDESGLCMMR